MKDRVSIILVSPQKGENIGFVARAMMNFGLSDLRIVSPRDGWPNKDADATAVKAVSILENASIFGSFADAVSDLNYTYVTTARSRDMNKNTIESFDLSDDIKQRFESGVYKIGIVFGPERSGVDNDVVSLSNKIVHIPIGSDFASLNLGMAAGVICYEIVKLASYSFVSKDNSKNLASHSDIKNLIYRLDMMLQESNFYQVSEKRDLMLQNLNSVISRVDALTKNEVNTLIGMFRSLYEYRQR